MPASAGGERSTRRGQQRRHIARGAGARGGGGEGGNLGEAGISHEGQADWGHNGRGGRQVWVGGVVGGPRNVSFLIMGTPKIRKL